MSSLDFEVFDKDYSDLRDAVAKIGPLPVTLVITKQSFPAEAKRDPNKPITPIIVPDTMRLRFTGRGTDNGTVNGTLKIGDDQVVIIKGPIIADPVTIFELPENVVVRDEKNAIIGKKLNFYANTSILNYPIQWFGVTGKAATNDAVKKTRIQKTYKRP